MILPKIIESIHFYSPKQRIQILNVSFKNYHFVDHFKMSNSRVLTAVVQRERIDNLAIPYFKQTKKENNKFNQIQSILGVIIYDKKKKIKHIIELLYIKT